jgi:hypothetical protein
MTLTKLLVALSQEWLQHTRAITLRTGSYKFLVLNSPVIWVPAFVGMTIKKAGIKECLPRLHLALVGILTHGKYLEIGPKLV